MPQHTGRGLDRARGVRISQSSNTAPESVFSPKTMGDSEGSCNMNKPSLIGWVESCSGLIARSRRMRLGSRGAGARAVFSHEMFSLWKSSLSCVPQKHVFGETHSPLTMSVVKKEVAVRALRLPSSFVIGPVRDAKGCARSRRHNIFSQRRQLKRINVCPAHVIFFLGCPKAMFLCSNVTLTV